MSADSQTWLPNGSYRDSVRIESYARYDGGIAPWGCGVWPAWWTVGPDWPYNGEIDIIEGVHDNQHNQVAFHTAPDCKMDPSANYTGTISDAGGYQHTDCNGLINSNAGCGVTEWSRASYGPLFDEQGGGVFAMKWDENGIAVWSFFRAAVPEDIGQGTPNPGNWGLPSAILASSQCNPLSRYFNQHSIVFDITFCGDWAGNSYATSGCPGTCDERLMDPTNFVNATWSINYMRVYEKVPLYASLRNSAAGLPSAHTGYYLVAVALLSSGNLYFRFRATLFERPITDNRIELL
ncbi:hypothetical protein FA13DRAFT_1728812 [Coprinellus micaceus]|uniref:GH16 domain-containing protein n=1 Tax=Coprinellus micaceus TaxID=71717 RepID=A0A4Y7TNA5_COPMI|nr:hypothetical protein FA13DRAFT_1728812 [Coprinellus micaceus]